MIGEFRTVGDGGGGAMSLSEIERGLSRLRANDDGTIGARASVLNLIVVTDEESAEGVTRVINELSGRYPSRALVMISDPEEERANLEIGISVFCNVRGGAGTNVCAEGVTLHVEGPPARHLESLAGPLLLPDLPVFLWYPNGNTPASPKCDGMAALAGRIVLDTGAAPDPESSLRAVADLVGHEETPAVGDLQWAALSPWRSLVRDLFTPPERAGELGRIRRVEVQYAPDARSRALLFAGWLSSCLGWRPEAASRTDEGGRELTFAGPSGTVTVLLTPNDSDAALRTVRLRCDDGLSFEVSRHRESTDARSTVLRGDEPVGERTVHLGPSDTGALLGEELRLVARDEIYEAALHRAVEILNL
ncbi:MAG: hypothetical protein AVDCRST_MAG25-2084 [uncultured Rubrobacteraceae bacterium]|uniref:OpcA, an allosteric effector of glucose-6-phosphate dehydrogenase, actinobacterial n=1 Tax=uncultured Rubrobacteraceae bacterium TaxID=349277 RepID=A0A6J4RPD3_9ACTN|nr:MAG: hypothetical protein AVDCRST_MAG25-2084 [uncultured Rubrobacteraceae bacterium]